MKRDLQYLAISLLGGIVAGLFLSLFIEIPLNPTKEVTSTVIDTTTATTATPCSNYWEGAGNRSGAALDYDTLRSSLKEQFGYQLIEVGINTRKVDFNQWLVLLSYASLTQDDDIEFVKKLFPQSARVTIGVAQFNTPIILLQTKPPIIEINCG